MAKDVFEKLAHHLDQLPGGFPKTESGVEFRILKRLFTPEQAQLAVKLTIIPEQANVIAKRAGMSVDEITPKLDEMASSGLIFNIIPNGKPTLYMAAQYVVGIWEYNLNNLDEELIRDMNEYIPTLVNVETWKQAPQLRTIPVGRAIDSNNEIMIYEQAEKIIKSQKRILVAPCICRKEHTMIGEGCDKFEEACLIFGWGTSYYERNGLGRQIDVDEALEILKKADKSGLVLQPGNSKKPGNICCCCGCCCQVLINMKRQPKPALVVSTPFTMAVDVDSCKGCGVCIDRCQMEAVSMTDDKVVHDADRCIGCGLCVTTCPTKSLQLVRKPDNEQPDIPKNSVEATLKLARSRGKLGPAKMAAMSLKSKVDRLLAAK